MKRVEAIQNHGEKEQKRQYPIGAEIATDGGAHFRVWAPKRKKVQVIFVETGETILLENEGNGYFSGFAKQASAGAKYKFRLDENEQTHPDPASRYQPDGPHGPSQLIDPQAFEWSDKKWQGVPLTGQIAYEMHIGTFTPEGTFAAAQEQLPELKELGITLLEIMPVGDFPGEFGWGYDGVNLFAPTRLYGTPDDFKSFINEAHQMGIGVILDVVYNHLGPDGNYLREFSNSYFSTKHKTDWGEAINFYGNNSEPVREFFLTNARYWIQEFHLDGLRLDATQDIFDESEPHIILEISKTVKAAAGKRNTILVGENEPQHTHLLLPENEHGYELDALWNDDFHHTAMVALTGRREAYYMDYKGSPQEFISCAKYGFLYTGQHYRWQKQRRGTINLNLQPVNFFNFLQNHDQIANSAMGLRAHQLASPGIYKALSALQLLMPGTPMFFQGQEFAATAPFLYFADHKEKLAAQVNRGRKQFLKQFRNLATPDVQKALQNACDKSTFLKCKIEFSEREKHRQFYMLHKDLINIKLNSAPFNLQQKGGIDGAVLHPHVFALRYFNPDDFDKLLLVNLGNDINFETMPEPLMGPQPGYRWAVQWSTEFIEYGGNGAPEVETPAGWRIPGQSAIILQQIKETK